MRLTPLVASLCGAALVVACHHPAPVAQLTPQPNADSLATWRRDSTARADAARAEQARLAAQRRADSLAALTRKEDAEKTLVATMIHFDFDKATIRTADAELLDQKLPALEANPALRIQVAGNCDERGSDEYNLALGNRRAMSAKLYLVSHGIAASRIETVSYGKERPVDHGHNETAWAMDRNDQFTLLNANVVTR